MHDNEALHAEADLVEVLVLTNNEDIHVDEHDDIEHDHECIQMPIQKCSFECIRRYYVDLIIRRENTYCIAYYHATAKGIQTRTIKLSSASVKY